MRNIPKRYVAHLLMNREFTWCKRPDDRVYRIAETAPETTCLRCLAAYWAMAGETDAHPDAERKEVGE